ncbi:hypothetical protein BHE74_00047392 [Ensete ventricosum]|uniref:Uncharacterized protein n=1 Tax=Ensete ventricosum TaxID=4639 RepID=A0A426YTL2_ENSVE|nr:hypothetical protein B296_00040706 [Ensete ventricosum]RWW25653.1 hypothetical protein GW17_00009982 [Ensete ventricosum]RWW46661.1 hypothetical protein BHE74_00047392 [Ensete ventricosum]RZR74464.1 hypothetical protein BHM03_00037226 [Ensete ventricosum]
MIACTYRWCTHKRRLQAEATAPARAVVAYGHYQWLREEATLAHNGGDHVYAVAAYGKGDDRMHRGDEWWLELEAVRD